MKRQFPEFRFCSLVALTLLSSTTFASAENQSLSTSAFIPIPSIAQDKTIAACTGKKAGFGHSYVSIAIERMTVNRADSYLYTIFNPNRTTFGSATLSATYNSQSLSVTKIGSSIALNGKKPMVDLGVSWGMLDRIPWVIRNATFNIKLGYSADSAIDSTVNAFNGITSAIPGYTLSTSLATGFAVTKAADNLLFGPSRATDLLRAERSLPLMADQLCDGYYVVFAASNKAIYEKYSAPNIYWSEQAKDLSFNGIPISDASYVVVSVKVADSFYPAPEDAFNDSSKLWASKYQDVLSSLADLAWVGTIDEVVAKQKAVRTNLNDAHTLLTADMDLTMPEKDAIHKYAQDEALQALNVAMSRVKANKEVTVASTTGALSSIISMNSKIVPTATKALIANLVQNPTKLPQASDDLGRNLSAAATSLRTVILSQ